jgi:Cof subfamily protein (haloacid dehalogenase superfamily)
MVAPYSAFSTPNDTPVATPSCSPFATPNDTPLTTPGASPVQKPINVKPLPRAEDIHMILSDVDGTLFTDDHELHPRTLDAIRHIRKTRPEIPIIPVTGKQRVSCGGLIQDLGIEEFPAGCLHGAIIYDNKGNIERYDALEPNFVLGVTELMKKHNKTTMLYVADWVAMASLEQGGKTDWEAVSRGFDPCVKDARQTDFLEKVLAGEEQIGKIFLPMDEELVPKFLNLLRAEFPNTPFKTTQALPYIIEIVAETVDKSSAMAYFCEKFNVKPENCISFGDGENDCGMFRACGYSVSMGNAMPLPRQTAIYQTATNNEGGVGLFLDRIFRPNRPDAALSVEGLKSLDGHPTSDALEIVA